jgi:hypothetical protein
VLIYYDTKSEVLERSSSVNGGEILVEFGRIFLCAIWFSPWHKQHVSITSLRHATFSLLSQATSQHFHRIFSSVISLPQHSLVKLFTRLTSIGRELRNKKSFLPSQQFQLRIFHFFQFRATKTFEGTRKIGPPRCVINYESILWFELIRKKKSRKKL